MRHRKSGRKLKRTASHRKALLAGLATSLLRNKRITTTVAKARETRPLVEKIITRSRHALANAGNHDAATRSGKFLGAAGPARREISRFIKDRSVVTELFSTIAPRVATRPGGYTRIVKLGRRQGDGAELAVIELVDFQTGQEKEEKPSAPAKKKSPRKGAPAGRKKQKPGAVEAGVTAEKEASGAA
jgi:large subunit ribosomal protein L17